MDLTSAWQFAKDVVPGAIQVLSLISLVAHLIVTKKNRKDHKLAIDDLKATFQKADDFVNPKAPDNDMPGGGP